MKSINVEAAVLKEDGYETGRVSGEAKKSIKVLTEESGHEFGVFEVTPGEWDHTWNAWETITVLSGEGTITDETGTVHEVGPGTLLVIAPGETLRWNVRTLMRKTYTYPAGSMVY